ncbi:MAG TPA: CYTH and CHAD domain-containing protein [Gaiellaceae bacterium]|nr:CYTH and CHAD domain-containing protein [Gaiellaceae bacterium]
METILERELKLEPTAGFELPELPGEPLDSRVFTSTYYDTPPRSLAAVGITLRRRVENGRSLWQLKLPRDEGRAEIEAPGGPVAPPDELAALLVAHLRHGELEPIATLRTRRVGVRVTTRDGGRVADVTHDVVTVMDAGRATGAFEELEIELLDGDEDDLEKLARRLRRAGAEPSDGAPKVMRVLGLRPAKPRTGKTTLDRLRALLETQFRELEKHDPGVRLGDDPEDVHKFRVATRRTRALVRATRPLLGDTLEPLAVELKWLAQKLGEVRDLDVMLEHLRDEARSLGDDAPAAWELVAVLEVERERNRRDLLEALESDRYLALLHTFASSVALLPDLNAKPSLRRIAADSLQKLRKAARALPANPPDDELHALRIRAKRARYAGELAATEGGGKRMAGYLDALKRLQDVVGEHHDAVVAEERLRRIARARTAVAAGRLVERERERRRERREEFGDALERTLRRGRKALA